MAQTRINQLDATQWDAFVASSPNGHFMQSHAWGTMQFHAGWTAHYLAFGTPEEPSATALLLSRSVPGLMRRIFYCPRGPVIRNGDQDVLSSTCASIREYVRGNGGIFARFDPYEVESSDMDDSYRRAGLSKVPRDWSYWNAPRFVFWLDLEKDENTLFKGMSSGSQRDIKAGYKKAVEYIRGSVSDIPEFHRLMVGMSTTKGIAVHDEEYYRRVYMTMRQSCTVELFLARFEQRVVAVGMSIMQGRKAWLLYAASDREHAKLGVNRIVQWEMIKWAHAAGCTRYDFRGTATGDPPDPADPGYGVYQFKKSFGPEFTRLAGYYDLVGRKALYSGFRLAEERLLPAAYKTKVWLDERRARKEA